CHFSNYMGFTVKSSQLNQTQTEENKVETNKGDFGGSEPSSSFHPHRHLQRKTDEQNEDCEEIEDSDEDQTLNHKLESKLPTYSSTQQMETEIDGDDGRGSEPDIILEPMDTHTGQKLVGSSECEQSDDAADEELALSQIGRDEPNRESKRSADGDVKVKKTYPCDVCSKSFDRPCRLQIHQRTHTGERPFQCPDCDKSFRSKALLSAHERTHSGERPFCCHDCGKCFLHNQTHVDELPHRCPDCGKPFRRKDKLMEHMRIHTGEKPYQCALCDATFRWRAGLNAHQQNHTVDEAL
uniref:C2H2-type domain-containing protein n=1 Tax=Sphaeramia orbicularis TaxID=375764 RepID=A0A672ZFD9_9TELE